MKFRMVHENYNVKDLERSLWSASCKTPCKVDCLRICNFVSPQSLRC